MPFTPTANVDTQCWMNKVLDIDRLKLTDLIWPGVHNAGMDKKAPNYEVIVGNWTTCQNDSFAWQLAKGARAFDLRLGYTPASPAGTFYFHHNGHQSHRVLDELLDAVNNFLERNPDEFIVLDFHQLRDGDQPFDFKQFNDLVKLRLGARTIAPDDDEKTIGELKAASSKKRVVLASRYSVDLDLDYFWSSVPHRWSGSRLTNVAELRQHIVTTLDTPRFGSYLWSLTATSYSFLGGPVDIKEHINDWFHSSRDWVTQCSIISTDFFDESEIVGYCWVANSMKAVSLQA
ncbi:PI-PLC domain-containing protein [Pseudomonas prosekii]|uniref:1-phosphatidylinositol phosphodiesterase n=1 Tax=Pseudomonas prosekii TaxID=1148509 RepID=A0A1H2BSE2_9PSED|nr:phospholipase [Pseudomonas prosekii]SDT60829.1 1-phosphatidylinositol phosphodiesterase [Pseudomonas prosekii]